MGTTVKGNIHTFNQRLMSEMRERTQRFSLISVTVFPQGHGQVHPLLNH